MQEPGDVLRRARRDLDGFPGVESIGEWVWNESEEKWRLDITVRRTSIVNPFVPEISNWIIVPDNELLEGEIEFYPATTDSVEITFQHQRYNALDKEQRRRTGRPCLTRPSHPLGRMGTEEPLNTSERLVWRVSRLIDWLNDAAAGSLVYPDDPFELPDFLGAADRKFTYAFQENSYSLQEWQTKPHYGDVDILRIFDNVNLITDFKNKDEILHAATWGNLVKQAKGQSKAIWVRLDTVPVNAPWTPPGDFGELAALLTKQGFNLRKIVSEVADRHPDDLRSGKPIVILIGFPIPKRIGQSADCLHWQTAYLPPISDKKSNGFRSGSLAMRDEMVCLRSDDKIEWQKSENWAEQNLLTRGAFRDELRKQNVTIIGAGTLGSSMAELLVRGGFHELTIIDRDTFDAGNANRHVLGLSSVGHSKAKALRNRLQFIRPGVNIKAIPCKVAQLSEEDLKIVQTSSLVIDTTGNNDVLYWAERELRESNGTFVSLSFGYAAKRLFCFACPASEFSEKVFATKINPWLAHERLTSPADVDLPREGIGCWSVVFPARADDVWLLAAAGVKWLESIPQAVQDHAHAFDVFEQKTSASEKFSGIGLAELPKSTSP